MARFKYPNINEVDIDDEDVISYVAETYSPEQIFPEYKLANWAILTGWSRGSKNKTDIADKKA